MGQFIKRIINSVGDGLGFGLGLWTVLKIWGCVG